MCKAALGVVVRAGVPGSTMNAEHNEDGMEFSGLLSQHVSSPQQRFTQILSRDQLTWRQRTAYWLYQHHTIGNATLAALLISVLVILAVAGIGHFWASSSEQAADYANEILSLAQIIGGIYAILLAVITFSVQTHAQRDDEGAFLASYLHRKHGSYWVSAVAAAATLVNVFAPVARSLGVPQSLPALLVIDILLAPLVILWSLWFLHFTTRDVSLRVDDVVSDPSDSRFEAFRRDVAWAIAIDQFQADFAARFERVITKTRLNYNPYAEYLSAGVKQRQRFEFNLPSERFIADINLDALRALAETLGGLPGEWIMRATVRPFSITSTQPALVIIGDTNRDQPEAQRTSSRIPEAGVSSLPTPFETLTNKQKAKIQNLVDQVFVSGRPQPTPRELNDFFRRFGQRLLSTTIEGTSVEQKQSLEGITNFVRYWCELGRDTNPGADPLWLLNSSSAFVGPLAIELFEVVEKAMESTDFDKAESVLNFLISNAIIALDSLHSRLFMAVTRYIPF